MSAAVLAIPALQVSSADSDHPWPDHRERLVQLAEVLADSKRDDLGLSRQG